MKFSVIKFFSIFLITAGGLGFSIFSSADDLKISNDSKYNLSFSINNICSEEFGAVDYHSIKVIPSSNFDKACSYSPSNCTAKVYNAVSCTGKQIATVGFDTSYGVQGVYPIEIITKGNGFNLFFEGIADASSQINQSTN